MKFLIFCYEKDRIKGITSKAEVVDTHIKDLSKTKFEYLFGRDSQEEYNQAVLYEILHKAHLPEVKVYLNINVNNNIIKFLLSKDIEAKKIGFQLIKKELKKMSKYYFSGHENFRKKDKYSGVSYKRFRQ